MKNGDTRQPQLMSAGYVGAVPSDESHAHEPDGASNGATSSHCGSMANVPLKIFIPTSRIIVPMAERRKRYSGNDGGAIRMTPYDKRQYDRASLNRTVTGQMPNTKSTVISSGWLNSTAGKPPTDSAGSQQHQQSQSQVECFLPDETDEMIVAVAKFMAVYPNSDPLEVYQLLLSATARRPPSDSCGTAAQSTSSSISVIKPTFVPAGHGPHATNVVPPASRRLSPKPPARNVIRHGAEFSNALGSTLGSLGSTNSAFCRVTTSLCNDYSSISDPSSIVSEQTIDKKVNSSAKNLAELLANPSFVHNAGDFHGIGGQNGIPNHSASLNHFDNNQHQQQQQQQHKQHEESLLSAMLSATTTRKSPYVPESRTELQSGLAGPCAAVPLSLSAQFAGTANGFVDDSHVKQPYSTTLPPYYRAENSLAHLDSPPKPYGDFSCSSTSAYSSSRYSATSPSANGARSDSSDRSSRPSASPHSATSSRGAEAGDGPLADSTEPDGKPDTERYKDRRRRNNEAAKRCRANRRAIFEFRSRRVAQLERENVDLRAQMARLRAELDRFRAVPSFNNNFNNNDGNNNTLIVQQQQQQQQQLLL